VACVERLLGCLLVQVLMLTNFVPLGGVLAKQRASMLQELLKCVVC
jgi:hypothetical protein